MSNFGFDFRAPMRVAHHQWRVFKDVDGVAVRMADTPTLWKAEQLMAVFEAPCWAERIGAERSEAA